MLFAGYLPQSIRNGRDLESNSRRSKSARLQTLRYYATTTNITEALNGLQARHF
jgi:hypothetical protein